jgi:hypothetical protein
MALSDFMPGIYLVHDSASPPAPSGLTFLSELGFGGIPAFLTGTFTSSYTLDAAGLPAMTIPTLAYVVIFVDSSDGTVIEPPAFFAGVSWTDSAGVIGAGRGQSISFTAPTSPGSGVLVASDPGGPLMIPALPAGDVLTVTGFYKLAAESLPDGSGTLIKIGTVAPEPGTLLSAGLAMFGWAVLTLRGKWRLGRVRAGR